MPRGQESALKRLSRLRDERAQMDTREAELRGEAANELGALLFDAEADRIDPTMLVKIIKRVRAIGAEDAIKRLEAAA